MENNEKKVATVLDYVRFRELCAADDIICKKCPFSHINNGYDMHCEELLMKNPQAYNDILVAWFEEKDK